MAFLDFLKRVEKASPRELFSILVPQQAPGLKENEYLSAYTRGWVFASVRKIADQVALAEFSVQQLIGDEWQSSKNAVAQQAPGFLSRQPSASAVKPSS